MGSHEPPVASTDRSTATRREWWRVAVVVVLGAITLVVALAIIDALRIRADIKSGQATLTSLDFPTIDHEGGIVPITDRASNRLHRAETRAAHSRWLGLLSHVPVLGDQVAGIRDLSRTVDRIGELARVAGHDVQGAIDRGSKSGPSGRVALVDEMASTAAKLQASLRDITIPTDRGLLPPLSGARDDFARKLTDADGQLDQGRRTLATLRAFLVGPRRYLVLGGNNAEMRSVGIATTSGLAAIADGNVRVGQFYATNFTQIPKPGVPLPDGWDWLYGYLDPDTQLPNTVASPNFDRTGQVASRIADRDRFGPVDGVIYVDTVALQVLLDVVGPVEVDGTTYDEKNAARILINENYLKYSLAERPERRDAQGRVAQAIFDALNTRDVSLVKLAARLVGLAEQRHIAAWSAHADEEKLWDDVGAAGVRHDNDLLIAAEELGTSKLDFYVTLAVDMRVEQQATGRRVSLDIAITNPPRATTSDYIEGGSRYANPGEYGVYLIGFLPRPSFGIDHPDPSWTSWALDGPLQATTFTTRVPVGTTKTVHLSFSVPNDVDQLNLVPSARLRAAAWTYRGEHFNDLYPRALDLTSGHNGAAAGWLVSGLLLVAIAFVLVGDATPSLTAAGSAPALRVARFDVLLGRFVLVAGVAMITVQMVIYARG